MGFSISWVAVKGKDIEVVLRHLALTPTGERDELAAESPAAGASLPGGWYVVVLDRYEHRLLGDEILMRISEGCDAVAAGAEEHVMCSYAAGWQDGKRIWSCTHDAQEGTYHLEAEGSLPAEFDSLRRQRFEEQDAAGGSQADVDYIFDIPLDAATRVTGFSHMESEPDDGFAVLTPAT